MPADITVGAAVCWELMRTQTVRRLRGRVDLALTGSGWWSLSENWPPRAVMRRLEASNHRLAVHAAESFALYVGAPVIHAAHAGALAVPDALVVRCPTAAASRAGRWSATRRGASWPTATATRARASRSPRSSPAAASRCVSPPTASGCTTAARLAALAWNYQRLHGRPWYRKHVRGRPAHAASQPKVPA